MIDFISSLVIPNSMVFNFLIVSLLFDRITKNTDIVNVARIITIIILSIITKKYYCGIDIHAIKMVVCIKNQKGKTLLHQEIPSKMEPLLEILKPYIPDVVVA
jgi:hypothetical protein